MEFTGSRQEKKGRLKEALTRDNGLLRLAPAWVPRSFLTPGGRLRLADEDLYALGAERGGIDERWLASTTRADNGPGTPEDEGMSYVVLDEGAGSRLLLSEAVELMGDEILGHRVMAEHGGWMVLAKLFDNRGPIHFHVHLTDEEAARVGKYGKPESYFFPEQLNRTRNSFPYTFFGLNPGTRREDIVRCLERWDEGDNGILYHSRAYMLKPGTGWYVPAGLLHAPGSLVTYEIQRASDVASMFQSLFDGRPVSRDLLNKDFPPEHHNDMEYIVSTLDWEENTDPHFFSNHHLEPEPVLPVGEMAERGYREEWIVRGEGDFSGRRLTVHPGRRVTLEEDAAHCMYVVEGVGTVNGMEIEAPHTIRYGELTRDEVFVTVRAAREGLEVVNRSRTGRLVILKHYGPEV